MQCQILKVMYKHCDGYAATRKGKLRGKSNFRPRSTVMVSRDEGRPSTACGACKKKKKKCSGTFPCTRCVTPPPRPSRVVGKNKGGENADPAWQEFRRPARASSDRGEDWELELTLHNHQIPNYKLFTSTNHKNKACERGRS